MNLKRVLALVHFALAAMYLVFVLFGAWSKRSDPDQGVFSSDGGAGFGLIAAILGVLLVGLAVMRLMGRSQVVPGLHPYVPIAPEGTAGHTAAFAEASKSPMANEGLIVAAKALAMTTVDLLTDPDKVEAAWAAFREQKAEQEG